MSEELKCESCDKITNKLVINPYSDLCVQCWNELNDTKYYIPSENIKAKKDFELNRRKEEDCDKSIGLALKNLFLCDVAIEVKQIAEQKAYKEAVLRVLKTTKLMLKCDNKLWDEVLKYSSIEYVSRLKKFCKMEMKT